MKKHIAMLCAVLLTALAAFAPGAAAAGPALTATEAYCIIDADTGLVLAQQNMNEELHPASITKVMTLGLACEKAQGKWDNVKLTVSHEDVYSLAGTDSSHIALQEGEEVPLTDALYATMMASANDGANLLAEYFGGGSIEGGVAAMNAQAKELGLEAGTLNVPGIAGLGAGVRWLLTQGVEALETKENALARLFYETVREIPGVRLYGDFTAPRAPIVSLNLTGEDSARVADVLWEEYGICVRAGAHCAPLMHKALGTVEQGVVRFSFSHTNTREEALAAARAVRSLAEE